MLATPPDAVDSRRHHSARRVAATVAPAARRAGQAASRLAITSAAGGISTSDPTAHGAAYWKGVNPAIDLHTRDPTTSPSGIGDLELAGALASGGEAGVVDGWAQLSELGCVAVGDQSEVVDPGGGKAKRSNGVHPRMVSYSPTEGSESHIFAPPTLGNGMTSGKNPTNILHASCTRSNREQGSRPDNAPACKANGCDSIAADRRLSTRDDARFCSPGVVRS